METLHAIIVDDDPGIRDLLSKFLKNHLFKVSQAENARDAESILLSEQPDVMLLDVMMSGEDGISFCRRVRDVFQKPIIILSAIDDDTEKIVAHEVGADDYLTKPYNLRVLLAKIKSALRRYQLSNVAPLAQEAVTVEQDIYQFNSWQLNISTHQLLNTLSQKAVILSAAEYKLLLTFIMHPQRVLSRDQLLEFTQGSFSDSFDRSIDILISRLRKKMEDDPKKPTLIITIRNGGYLFDSTVSKQKTHCF